MVIGLTTRAESIFCAAVGVSDPSERAAYLRQACGHDGALLSELERLVENHFRAGRFLEASSEGATATASQSPIECVGSMIGRYKLLEQIGEGGMGIVYMAEQTETLRRRVALKIIKPGMDTRQVVARFEAERQALAMMDHPNIARVIDGGETDAGRPYFVMELVHGMPITDYCDKAHLNAERRLRLLLAVCQAVQHAHQKGIIHRDLKPTNVLVASHDGKPVPKVIDFGIAKAMGHSLTDRTLFTAFSQVIGTPLYMSPEQAEMSGQDVDTRSDVYSLGVLCYELLTGRTPFDKDTFKQAGFDDVRRIFREVAPLRPSQQVSTLKADEGSTVSQRRGIDQRKLVRVLHGELDWVVMKALEKDRNRRYESVSAFAADIQRYLDKEPVLASPPSPVYRFRKFVRRRRTLLGVSGVVFASLLLVLWVSVAAAWRLSERADELAVLSSNLANERDSLETVLLRVVAQNALSDALLDPTTNQDYRTRAQFASEALEDAPTSPTLHFLAATALNDAIHIAESDLEMATLEREQLRLEYSLRLAAVLQNWTDIEDGSHPGLTNALAWMLLTAARSEVHDAQQALQLAKELCERYPTHGPYLNTLALAYLRTGEYGEAIDSESRALAQQDGRLGDAWPHIVLALAHAKLGQLEKAAQVLGIAETAMTNRRHHWGVKALFAEAKELVDRNEKLRDPAQGI